LPVVDSAVVSGRTEGSREIEQPAVRSQTRVETFHAKFHWFRLIGRYEPVEKVAQRAIAKREREGWRVLETHPGLTQWRVVFTR